MEIGPQMAELCPKTCTHLPIYEHWPPIFSWSGEIQIKNADGNVKNESCLSYYKSSEAGGRTRKNENWYRIFSHFWRFLNMNKAI